MCRVVIAPKYKKTHAVTEGNGARLMFCSEESLFFFVAEEEKKHTPYSFLYSRSINCPTISFGSPPP